MMIVYEDEEKVKIAGSKNEGLDKKTRDSFVSGRNAWKL